MQLPDIVWGLMNRLAEAGYSAYAVGGCVRDTLLGKEPKDWDICTSARPEETERVFAGERLIETGIRHGTVAVVQEKIPYEITTFRIDGEYTDHRHPDCVDFVDRVDEDLARRDFTINAMACDRDGKILDLFDGQQDLRDRIIRCVGVPEMRFEEDALRILRAMRFAATLDFTIEEETSKAIHRLYPTLARVAAERKRTELVQLLCGPAAGRILREYEEVITFLIPSLKAMVGYDQENPHHRYTVWEHTIRALENVPPEPDLRVAMLMHDSGKPFVRTTDAQGIGHYAGHQEESARLAAEMMEAMKFDRATRERVVRLVRGHDIPLSPEKKLLTRRLNQYGERDLRALFAIHRADRIATGTRNPEHATDRCAELNAALDALLREQPCYQLKDMQIDGTDLVKIGYRGPEIGRKLEELLGRIMEGSIGNEREALLQAAKEEK